MALVGIVVAECTPPLARHRHELRSRRREFGRVGSTALDGRNRVLDLGNEGRIAEIHDRQLVANSGRRVRLEPAGRLHDVGVTVEDAAPGGIGRFHAPKIAPALLAPTG